MNDLESEGVPLFFIIAAIIIINVIGIIIVDRLYN